MYPRHVRRLLRFTCTLLLMLATALSHALPVPAQGVLDRNVTLSLRDVPLKIALTRLESNTRVRFAYSRSVIQLDKSVSISAEGETLAAVLDRLLPPLQIRYEVVGGQILLSRTAPKPETPKSRDESYVPTESTPEAPADVTVSGRVTDEAGAGLPGVSVLLKGTQRGTATTASGTFSIAVPDGGRAVLVFSYVGYLTQEIEVGNRNQVDVSLQPSDNALKEIVVVGYGTQRKAEVTGSIASLNTQSIKDLPVANIGEAIAGRMPGVLVQQASGAPGSGPSIKIRGLGSISAGNGPLVVVDGQPLNSGDVVNAGSLSLINPNDIETVDILKDASATAIFGSRGANGVIMITTKRGKAGKSTINFDYYTGIQQVSKKMDVLNAQQFAELARDAANNSYLERVPGAKATDPNSVRPAGQRYRYPQGEFLGINYNDPTNHLNTDWQDLVFQTAPISSYQLSASGGTEKIQYAVSGNYLKQDGVIKRTGIDRFTFRSNIDAQLAPKVRVGMSLSPSYNLEQRGNSNGHWANNGIVNAALVSAPHFKPYQDDGSYFSVAPYASAYEILDPTNPVANIYEIDNNVNSLRLLGNAYVQVDVLKNLRYRGSVGGDLLYQRQNQFRTSLLPLSGLAPPTVSNGSSSTNDNVNWVTTHTLDYGFALRDVHQFKLLVGVEAQKNTFESNTISATNFPNDIVRTVNAGVISGGASLKEQWTLASYFARLGYNFKDKYLFNASVRRDGSSRFGENQRYGVFPSASVGWRVSEEAFLKKIDAISELKFKASFGLSGNNAFLTGTGTFENYGSIGILGSDNYVLGGTLANGLAATRIGNPNLTWEKSTQTDLGFELGLFNNRVFLVADYYARVTSDLLLAVQIPTITGFTFANQNIGKVRNRGVELGLTTRNVTGSPSTGAFSWTTDLNFSLNRNVVLALGPTGDAIRSGTGVGETNITVIGSPLGNFFGYRQSGVFKNQAELDASPRFADAKPGDTRYADVNGDGKLDANDRTIIGNNQPDFIYGITNTFSFKGFDLNVVIQGVQGGQILNLSRRFIENLEGNQNQLTTTLDRWRSPEQPGNGTVPRANLRTTGNSNAISTRWVEDASYFRVRNITLGYRVPSALTNRIRLQNVRVYGSIQNAFTASKYLGYNPEVSGYEGALTGGVDYGTYPLPRTMTIGLNAAF